MAAAITKLINATPEKRGSKAGFALEWRDSPRSPKWLSKADFETLRANLTALDPDLAAVLDAALAYEEPEVN